MTTDLRAALRDILTTRDEDEQARLSRIEDAITALADAPPTVAELLPRVVETSEPAQPAWRRLAGGHDGAEDHDGGVGGARSGGHRGHAGHRSPPDAR